ncbi:MAG: potassium channel protein [Acidimicrobiia bacterium]|nr:potassium channel protein [Acidimicrobiia bacterium]
MDDRPRNLRTMLSEAKDTSELMVDLAYAALYFGDPDMAEEVRDLERSMSDLVHDMRAVCILAARSPREAGEMASVLQVISAIERIANDAVDIARIVTHRLGIPRELVADLSDAEEVSHRVLVRDGSHMAHRPLSALELPVATGMRVVAIRRGRDWVSDVEGTEVLLPSDVLFLEGPAAGIPRVRELADAPVWEPPQPPEDGALTDLDRAVDTLVEMKNISEVAVGLAYSALVLRDAGLAAEVRHLEDRLDEMKDRLELWVLRAARDDLDPSPLRGLLHLSQAAEDIGDAAQQMVWLVEEDEEVHPILGLALGESDEVVVKLPVAEGSRADGAALSQLRLNIEPGFSVLAVQRGGRYFYRPRGAVTLHAGDDLIAAGPDEGRELLARLLGWELDVDEETGALSLSPADPGSLRSAWDEVSVR